MTPPLETPLHVLGRTNLDKYLIERAKLAAKTRGDVPENFRGRGAFIIGDENTFEARGGLAAVGGQQCVVEGDVLKLPFLHTGLHQ